MDMTRLFLFYGFDVMGDVAFGTQLDMLKSGHIHHAVEAMRKGMKPFGWLTHAPWLFHLLLGVPGAMTDFYRLVGWAHGEVGKRLKVSDLLT